MVTVPHQIVYPVVWQGLNVYYYNVIPINVSMLNKKAGINNEYIVQIRFILNIRFYWVRVAQTLVSCVVLANQCW
jgi:hypothetical protein